MANELRKGPSGPPFGELSSDSVSNESDIPGATVTDALNYLSTRRIGWVNAASSRRGTVFAGVTLEAAPAAWLTEADVPPGLVFTFREWGSAGGAGSGSVNSGGGGSFSVPGGAPSGGGACNEFTRTRAEILAALPIFFTLPLGGQGGAPVTANSISTTVGNPGAPGGLTRIDGTGLSEWAGGGMEGEGGGPIGTGAAGSGGGRFGSGISNTIGGQPNDPSVQQQSTIYNWIGGARSNTRTTTLSTGVLQNSVWGGAGGGSNGGSSSIVPGGRSLYGGCGGGHGGRVTNGLTFLQASDGGNHDMTPGTAVVPGGGGLAGVNNGEAGSPGPDGNATQGGQGGGGGMSGANANGGDGGDGGFPGGGAGGGGGSYRSTFVPTTSGRGGKGGDSLILLTITS